jgi:hypothetical protein
MTYVSQCSLIINARPQLKQSALWVLQDFSSKGGRETDQNYQKKFRFAMAINIWNALIPIKKPDFALKKSCSTSNSNKWSKYIQTIMQSQNEFSFNHSLATLSQPNCQKLKHKLTNTRQILDGFLSILPNWFNEIRISRRLSAFLLPFPFMTWPRHFHWPST